MGRAVPAKSPRINVAGPSGRARRVLADAAGGSPVGACPRCLELDGLCPRCVQRASQALRLLEQGCTVAEAGTRLRLAGERVLELSALARDRIETRALRRVRPLVDDARGILEEELAREPGLTRAEVARRMQPPMHPADLDRALRYAPPKPGRRPPKWLSVSLGGRLMIALGRDPRNLPGC